MARTLRWVAVAAVVLVAGYAVLGYFVAPGMIESRLVERLEARSGRPVSIGASDVNPFRFEVVLEDLRIGMDGEEPLATVARVEADVDPSSLFGGGWTFDALRLVEPSLRLAVGPDGGLDALRAPPEAQGRQAASASPDTDEGPRVRIERLAIVRGRLALIDRSVQPAATASITPIDLDVSELALGVEQRGRYTLQARLPGGGTLAADGRVAIAPTGLGGSLRVQGLRIANAWAFFRDHFGLSEPQGTVDVSGRWRAGPGGPPGGFSLEDADVRIAGLALARKDAADPFARLAEVRASGARFALATRTLGIRELVIADGRLLVARDARGSLNWRALVPASEPRADASSWRVEIGSVRTEGIAVRYVDRSRDPALAVDIDAAALAFGLRGEAGAGEPAARIGGLRGELAGIALAAPPEQEPLARIERLHIEGGRLDTAQARITAEAVTIRGGSATLAREAGGGMPLLEALAGDGADEGGRDWTARIRRGDAADLRLTLADRSAEPPVQVVANVAEATLARAGDDDDARLRTRLRAMLEPAGQVSLDGHLAADLSRAELRVDAEGIPIGPLSARLAARSALAGADGVAAVEGEVSIRGGEARAVALDGGRTPGAVTRKAPGGGRLLSWSRLDAESVRVRTGERRWEVERILALRPHANIVLADDRTPNFTGLLHRDTADAAPARPPYAWRIGRLDIEQGELRFTDHGVPGPVPFSALATDLRGALYEIDSAPGRHARLELEARIGAHAHASARARLDAADPLAYTEILAQLSNQPLRPLSPYAVEFAGRRIAGGRLWLDLDYRIENGALDGENRLVARRLRLGEEVSGPGVGDAPLGMAIAMLEGADERVRLSVPVGGSVRDPDFDYGAVFAAAFAGALEQVVAAPFEALDALVGSDDDAGGAGARLGRIAFQPGDAELAPRARWMVEQMAEILASRPAHEVVVPAGRDPEIDAAAMRRDRVRHALARELGRDPRPHEDAGPIAFGRARTQAALERLLAARGGEGAVAALAHRHGVTSGREPTRVDGAAASPDRDFYAAIFARLAALEPLPDGATAALARRRAQRIARALERAGVEPGRIRIGPVQAAPRDAGGDIVVRMALRRSRGSDVAATAPPVAAATR